MKGVAVLVLAYLLILGFICQQRLDQGIHCTFDLGIHDQTVWLCAQGLPPMLTTRGLLAQADHFSPIAWALAPIYWLWNSPSALIGLQTLWLGLGAFPVFALARHYGLTPRLSLGAAGLYLCQGCLHYSNVFDFHFSTLATTPLLLACLALERKDPWLYATAALTAMACSETTAVPLLALSPVAWIKAGPRFGLATLGLGLGGGALARMSIEWHNQGPTQYGLLYSHLANGGGVLAHLLRWDCLNYLLELFGPLLGLPLLAPLELLPGIPVLLGNLVSWRGTQQTIHFHYTAALLPFLMWATVTSLARWKAYPRRVGWGLALGCLIGLAVGPLAPGHWPPAERQAGPALDLLRRHLPAEGPISLPNRLGGSLSHRAQAYLFPNPMMPVAWGSGRQALIDQTVMGADPYLPGEWRRALDRVGTERIIIAPGLSSEFPLNRPDRRYLEGEVLNCPRYGIEMWGQGVVVLKRGLPQHYGAGVLPEGQP